MTRDLAAQFAASLLWGHLLLLLLLWLATWLLIQCIFIRRNRPLLFQVLVLLVAASLEGDPRCRSRVLLLHLLLFNTVLSSHASGTLFGLRAWELLMHGYMRQRLRSRCEVVLHLLLVRCCELSFYWIFHDRVPLLLLNSLTDPSMRDIFGLGVISTCRNIWIFTKLSI